MCSASQPSSTAKRRLLTLFTNNKRPLGLYLQLGERLKKRERDEKLKGLTLDAARKQLFIDYIALCFDPERIEYGSADSPNSACLVGSVIRSS